MNKNFNVQYRGQDIIKGVKDDSKNIKDLYVTNYRTKEKIYLDNNLRKILKGQGLKYEIRSNMSKEEELQFKLQLWLEEYVTQINSENIYTINFNRIIKTQEKKFEFQGSFKKIKGLEIVIDKSCAISDVISHFYVGPREEAIEYKSTAILHSIGKQYLYRNEYYGRYVDLSFEGFIKKYKIDNDTMYLLGKFIIEPFDSLGLIKLDMSDSEDFRDRYYAWVPSEEFKKILTNVIINSNNVPKISKPLDWIKINDKYLGGYYRQDLYDHKFVHKSSLHGHKLSDIENIIERINIKQSQPLAINTGFINYINDNNLININESDRELLNKASNYSCLIIYIPLYQDWRGRIYTSSSFFSYQGKSSSRCLFCIPNDNKNNLPQDNVGEYAIKIFIATQYGQGNKSNKDKIKWFENNIQNIINVDQSFLAKIDDDNKYEFLYGCYIYNYYNVNKLAPFPFFINFDATCSGIQHVSGILQDSKLGKFVNVGESSDILPPEDIYTHHIDLVKTKFNEKVLNDPKYSFLVNFNVNRKLLKKIIMTIPYSVTLYGITNQIINLCEYEDVNSINEKTKKRQIKRIYKILDINNNYIVLTKSQIRLMSKLIYDVIIEENTALNKLFKYYSEMSNILILLNIPITWQTHPDGVTVTQNYFKTVEKKINVRFGYKKIQVVQKQKSNPSILDPLKSRLGIVPNIIHSLDSTHLNMILYNFQTKNKLIFTIHDCFLIHPNDYEQLKNDVIQTYIYLYFNHNFLVKYHKTVINLIETTTDLIIEEAKIYIKINNKKISIPIPPFLNNPSMANSIVKSKYMIK